MHDDLHIPDKTKLDQRRAADPSASAWVSANAGAGKTKVLTDRVLRLLLAGAPPQRILCLTFTKTAAATMAIRVFETLGRWVMMDDAALADEIEALEGERPSPSHLSGARCLFARAVETPGGLKIETIHAFCERILHLVPFEAEVPARFTVLDESQVDEMIAQATADVLRDAASDDTRHLGKAYATVSVDAIGDALSQAIAAAVREVACKRVPRDLAGVVRQLHGAFDLSERDTPEAIERAMIEDGLGLGNWQEVARGIAGSAAARERKLGDAIASLIVTGDPAERLKLHRSIFFKEGGNGEPLKNVVTKSVRADVKAVLEREQARLVLLDGKLKAARTLARTKALYTLACAIVTRFEEEKRRRGALDFDDLIGKTLALLSRGDAPWVLYKLDRGIDHVLVDEAQDTNPEQWQILRHITEEFTAGAGGRWPDTRTIFAVGDPKQSIFSFQGADPRQFEEGRKHWLKRTTSAKLRFEEVRLDLSFRSARVVLSAVDATFALPAHHRGLSFEDVPTRPIHESARRNAPGFVELWPTVSPEEEEEPDAWKRPVDEPGRASPPVVLAHRIASVVKQWTTVGDEIERVWGAGDVLILVRKRGAAFEAVIRALKEAGVPVAGADRIDIGEHIAVLDLVAAGRAALLPDDDLTLAAVLKSPLVGLDDEDLIRIGAGRDDAESLAAALRRHAQAGDAAAQCGCERLAAWRDLAAAHGPFGFYATLLGPGGGRSKLVARLGNEAGDAIDAFLCYARSFETTDTPSLATFLCRFESASHQIKRDLDTARDEVRVTTVHGAKGIEAPIVIVIDGCDVLGRDPPLVPVPLNGDMFPVWSPGAKHDCGPLGEAREALRARGQEEHNRLLYVAMTRARDRLVIAPYRTAQKPSPEQAWCEMVRRGLMEAVGGIVRTEAPDGRLLWGDATPPPVQIVARAASTGDADELPNWLTTAAMREDRPPAALNPSNALPYAPSRRGADASAARRRGILIHALLERLPALPRERYEAVGQAYVQARAPRLAPGERARLVADALGVIDHDALRPLFEPAARAEAAIAGSIQTASGTRPVFGQIDRLAVLEREVLMADFKSGTVPGRAGAPPSYIGQLALYRALVGDIYPDRAVRAFLVWTAGPVVWELTEHELAGAFDHVLAA